MSEEVSSRPEFEAVSVHNMSEQFNSIVVCEHASNHFPEFFGNLEISEEAANSHAAWDPGAYEVSIRLSQLLNAPLVASEVSRLVYDCNRPPSASDAIPARSEIFEIPGNANLTEEARNERILRVYIPFTQCLEETISTSRNIRSLITIHSFTPVYNGQSRDVEIGILHDGDSRLADEMLKIAHLHSGHIIHRNEPYGPEHGVTHTLKKHGLANDLLNVMIEVRNDLIATNGQCEDIANTLYQWLEEALSNLQSDLEVEAQAS